MIDKGTVEGLCENRVCRFLRDSETVTKKNTGKGEKYEYTAGGGERKAPDAI